MLLSWPLLKAPLPVPGVAMPESAREPSTGAVNGVQKHTDVFLVGAWDGAQSLSLLGKHSPLSFWKLDMGHEVVCAGFELAIFLPQSFE